jgi:hypothetical protein
VARKEIDAVHRATGNPAFDGYQIHWLRATFVSAVRSQCIDDRLVKRYIGRSINDTMARHYEHLRPEHFAPVLRGIETWLRE